MNDQEKRKNEILSKLNTIKNSDVNKDIKGEWIDQAIAFIKEVANT